VVFEHHAGWLVEQGPWQAENVSQPQYGQCREGFPAVLPEEEVVEAFYAFFEHALAKYGKRL